MDVAFIAAPCCDETGNLNGVQRPVGLRQPGLRLHRRALRPQGRRRHRQPGAATRPSPVSISQSDVDYVVPIESLGDPKKIVSTTTRVTRDPAGPADRPLRRRGHRGVGPAEGRLLLPDRRRRHLAGRGRQRPRTDAGAEDQGQLRLRRDHRLLRGHAGGGATSRRSSTCSASTCRRCESIGKNLDAPGDQRRPLRQPVQPRVRWSTCSTA